MDHSKSDNVLITELKLQNAELTETVARLSLYIADLEETIKQEFPRKSLTASDIANELDQFLTSMSEKQPEKGWSQQDHEDLVEEQKRLRFEEAEETIHSDPILTKTNCNITKAFQANALDNMDYGQF